MKDFLDGHRCRSNDFVPNEWPQMYNLQQWNIHVCMKKIKGHDKIVHSFLILMNINCGHITNKPTILGYLLDFQVLTLRDVKILLFFMIFGRFHCPYSFTLSFCLCYQTDLSHLIQFLFSVSWPLFWFWMNIRDVKNVLLIMKMIKGTKQNYASNFLIKCCLLVGMGKRN